MLVSVEVRGWRVYLQRGIEGGLGCWNELQRVSITGHELCAAPSYRLHRRLEYLSISRTLRRGWSWYSFWERDSRLCAVVWIRYLQMPPATSYWLYLTLLRLLPPRPFLLFSSGFLSALAPPALVRLLVPPILFASNGAQEEAIAPGAFHSALPPNLGYQQVQVPLRYRTEPACHHQQPRHSNHHHLSKLAPVGSILSSALFLHLRRQCSLPRLLLQRPLRHGPVREPLYTSPLPVRSRQTTSAASLFRCCSLSPLHSAFPPFTRRTPRPPSYHHRIQIYLRYNPSFARLYPIQLLHAPSCVYQARVQANAIITVLTLPVTRPIHSDPEGELTL